jgi:hypothetical protein
MRRYKPKGQVTVSVYDAEDREVEVTALYHASTPAYFCRSFGNYLPGDEEDIEVLDAKALDIGADVSAVLADAARLEEAIREVACEPPDYPDTREEGRGER